LYFHACTEPCAYIPTLTHAYIFTTDDLERVTEPVEYDEATFENYCANVFERKSLRVGLGRRQAGLYDKLSSEEVELNHVLKESMKIGGRLGRGEEMSRASEELRTMLEQPPVPCCVEFAMPKDEGQGTRLESYLVVEKESLLFNHFDRRFDAAKARQTQLQKDTFVCAACAVQVAELCGCKTLRLPACGEDWACEGATHLFEHDFQSWWPRIVKTDRREPEEDASRRSIDGGYELHRSRHEANIDNNFNGPMHEDQQCLWVEVSLVEDVGKEGCETVQGQVAFGELPEQQQEQPGIDAEEGGTEDADGKTVTALAVRKRKTSPKACSAGAVLSQAKLFRTCERLYQALEIEHRVRRLAFELNNYHEYELKKNRDPKDEVEISESSSQEVQFPMRGIDVPLAEDFELKLSAKYREAGAVSLDTSNHTGVSVALLTSECISPYPVGCRR
jgi:hypothetical protein